MSNEGHPSVIEGIAARRAPAPMGVCEKCRKAESTCRAIPGPASRAYRRWRTCDACGERLVSRFRYRLIRLILGGRS